MKQLDYTLIITELLKNRLISAEDLALAKRKLSKKFKFSIVSNINLLKAYHNYCADKSIKPSETINDLLKKRLIRSLSGVAVVSVLTKPYPCPGKCLYCPTEKGMPKSYLSNEPAVMRAILNDFDPQKQVKTRLQSLEMQGHPTDKIELIIIGGTWSYLPKSYQKHFITECFRAANENSKLQIPNYKQIPNSKFQISKLPNEQKKNETAKNRIIGITIETRPDYINEKEILLLRKLGVTRVELGVQSVYDDALKFNLRGNSVKDIIQATKLLKDAGFKICYHIMPNLPGSDIKTDKKVFEELFSNPDFQPDLLKIYPCAVLREAPLYKLWQEGKYKPYAEKELINLLLEIKKTIPYYCRIQRLTRDIPSGSIVEGPAKISNMRQVLAKISEQQGWKCKCIRCREVRENYNAKEKLFLFRQEYDASGGKEIFLSYESKNRERLYSLLRLRIPSYIYSHGHIRIPERSSKERSEVALFACLKNSAVIRELHTYGQLHPLIYRCRASVNSVISPQHKGLGKKLIQKAEKIAKKEFGTKNIAVISGIGAREYYRRLEYKLKDTYMIKKLR